MTLKELYDEIGGDYEQAMKVLRIEKLMDKHIRRFPSNPVFAELSAAKEPLDGARLFEAAHAIKGVCSNLGLVKLSSVAADICDEFRPGCTRKYTDGEVKQKIAEAEALYTKAVKGIQEYEKAAQ